MARSSTFDAIIRLKDQASQQLSKIEANLVNHEKAWKRTGKSLQRYGDSVQNLGKTMTAGLTAPIMAAGTASFLMAAEYEDALGAVEQIYKDSSDAVKKWSDDLPSYYGIAKDEALGYASTMGAMLKNIGGLTDAEASKQSATLIELAGDLSAMFGGTTESAVQALTGALKGNNSMLDNYGMGVNEATIKTKALEMGLKSAGGQLSLADKQAATLALIMEQTADAQGQAAREADGASGSIKKLKTEMRNLAISIGEAVIPVVLPLAEKVNNLMGKFKGLDDSTKNMIVKVGLFVAAIGPMLLVFGAVIKSVGSAFIMFSKLSGIIAGAGTATSFFASAAFPIVAALTAIFVAGGLIIANWDKVKAKALEVWPGIGNFFIAMGARVRMIGGQFMELGGIIAGFFKSEVSMTFRELEPIIQFFGQVIMETVHVATQALRGLLEFLIGAFSGDWKRAWNGIAIIFTTIWDSIKEKGALVLNWFDEKLKGLLTKLGDSRILRFLTGGQSANWLTPTIGSNADGTSHWRGGLTTIHEKGGEIIDLQRGARVYPHDKSIQMAYVDGQKSAGGGTISVNFDGAVFHVREEADINRIGKTVAERLRFAAMNRGGGAVI